MFHKFSSFSHSEKNASLKLNFFLEAMFMTFSLTFFTFFWSQILFYTFLNFDFNRKSYKINRTIRTGSNHKIFAKTYHRAKKLFDFHVYTDRLILYDKSYTINCMV